MKTYVVLYRNVSPVYWSSTFYSSPILCYLQAESREVAAKQWEEFLDNDPNEFWGAPTTYKNDQEFSITLVYDEAWFYIFPCPAIEDCKDGFDSFC